jgi:hypothetical protein
MKLAILIMSLGLTTACTNHLYQGKTIYEDNGKTCEAIVYWNSTTHLFNPKGKVSSVVIRNASNLRSFTFSDLGEDKLTLVLPSDEYTDVINNTEGNTELTCGVFSGKLEHQEGQRSTTEFQLFCNKISHPLWPDTCGLRAQTTPFVFTMAPPTSEFSWTGQELKAEIKPVCS